MRRQIEERFESHDRTVSVSIPSDAAQRVKARQRNWKPYPPTGQGSAERRWTSSFDLRVAVRREIETITDVPVSLQARKVHNVVSEISRELAEEPGGLVFAWVASA